MIKTSELIGSGFAGDSYMSFILEKWKKLSPITRQQILEISYYVGMSEYAYRHTNPDTISDWAYENRNNDLTQFSTRELVKILFTWSVKDK